MSGCSRAGRHSGAATLLTAAAVLLSPVGTLAATGQILLSEVLGSWQGDDAVQFVELVLAADGATDVAGGILTFVAVPGERRSFQLPADVTNGVSGSRILIATERAAAVIGIEPDFVLPEGLLPSRTGRLCYQFTDDDGEAVVVDCVAYGGYAGGNGEWGASLRIGPDNRALEHVATGGVNRDDWRGRLRPTPQNNAGDGAQLETLCGDEHIDAGEECDGESLAGQRCMDFGFRRGELSCEQCHIDTSECIACGNGVINAKEQCDGADVGAQTCETLGFTGGTLLCTRRCRLDTEGCDPTFHVPGGGPAPTDCLAEWRLTNAAGRPSGNGKASSRQRCRDGDPGCDTDGTTGTCTFTVAVCLGREDPRLASCHPAPVGTWSLLRCTSPEVATALRAAVAALGASSVVGDAVSFSPPLDASAHCTADVPVTVPSGTKFTVKARTTAAANTPRDTDTLRLICVP